MRSHLSLLRAVALVALMSVACEQQRQERQVSVAMDTVPRDMGLITGDTAPERARLDGAPMGRPIRLRERDPGQPFGVLPDEVCDPFMFLGELRA